MPLYEYRCRACGQATEVRHGFGEGFTGACPSCGASDMARVFNPTGIVFKGSGFYINDSRKSTTGATEKPAAPATESAPAAAAPATLAGPAAPGAPAAAPATPAVAASDGGSKTDGGSKKNESSAA